MLIGLLMLLGAMTVIFGFVCLGLGFLTGWPLMYALFLAGVIGGIALIVVWAALTGSGDEAAATEAVASMLRQC